MASYGAEIILETAVFWGSRTEWNPEQSRYELTDVIGPDEYHDHVSNSAYTNHMVQWHLQTALEILSWLRQNRPEKAAELTARLDLSPARLARWADIIDHIYLGYDPRSKLIEQFQGFYNLEELDWASLEPREKSIQALLGIERTQQVQAIKQPDVLMLLYLLDKRYDAETLRANWEYYAARTDHSYGSSLSPAVHAILACKLGQIQTAYKFFMQAAWIDLRDPRESAQDGIHGASAGGVWQAGVFGVGGVCMTEQGLTATPRLPPGWNRLRFQIGRASCRERV